MSDKDLLVVISEMLRKQDQHAEILKQTQENLKELTLVSTAQFQEQYAFNNKFELEFAKQRQFNEEQKQFIEGQVQFNEGQKQFDEGQKEFNEEQKLFNQEQKEFNEEQRKFNMAQTQFNERLLNKLDDIEKALKK